MRNELATGVSRLEGSEDLFLILSEFGFNFIIALSELQLGLGDWHSSALSKLKLSIAGSEVSDVCVGDWGSEDWCCKAEDGGESEENGDLHCCLGFLKAKSLKVKKKREMQRNAEKLNWKLDWKLAAVAAG